MRTTSLLLTCALLVACDGGSGDPAVDAHVDAPPDAPGACQPAELLPTQWRPIAMVSTGALAVTTTGGVTSGTIDATAGGTAAAADNPYVYLDLASGTKVAISDIGALSSPDWHVAIKRSSWKLNGGDSGPGHVTGAAVAALSLDDITAVPAGLAADDWATSDCMLLSTPGGEPATVMSAWYDYHDADHTLTPKAEVWVLKLGDAADAPVRKLRITTYYGDGASPMRGAFYRVEWAAL
jgi:HmuY protein